MNSLIIISSVNVVAHYQIQTPTSVHDSWICAEITKAFQSDMRHQANNW